jgi:hypothetical protein
MGRAALRVYLRNGWHDLHGIARGPMAPVIDNLAALPETDLKAITTYVADIAGEPSVERQRVAQALIARSARSARRQAGGGGSPNVGRAGSENDTTGARIYQATCAVCNESRRPLPFGGIDLALSTGPSGPHARNLINVVLWGLPPAEVSAVRSCRA